MVRIESDTEAGVDLEGQPTQDERLTQLAKGSGGDFDGSLNSGDRWEQQGEFVASQTGNGVNLAHGVAKSRAQLSEKLVAGVVPERVVDPLELVEIEEDDGEPRARPLRGGERLLRPLLEQGAVRQVGQGIVEGQIWLRRRLPSKRSGSLGDNAKQHQPQQAQP